MNQAEQILLQAIRKSLWKTDIEFPADTDWEAVLKEAEQQALLGIAVDAAPPDVQKAWESRSGAVTVDFISILYEQSNLYALMKKNGIPMAILKGCAAACYYPNPSLRSMGDIDYLVPPAYFDRAKELMAQNGYTVREDDRNRRHIHISKGATILEQHRQFSSEGFDVEQYVADGMSAIEERTICGRAFPMLPKLANGLVLLGHLVQHLKTGLGLRQVIDWMMYVHAELDDAFWNLAFQQAVCETRLETVAITMTRLCQIALGLPDDIQWCRDADTALCSELLEVLLSSGNFNRKYEKGRSIQTVTSNLTRKGLFRFLQTAGEYNWAAYHRHKWLKPFAWIYQLGRYAKQGLSSKRSGLQLAEDFKRGDQRTKLLDKLGIR